MIACSRSYGRRRFSSRRRFGSVKKRIVGTAARAAKRTFKGTPMCKDLGTLVPKCCVVKLRYHFSGYPKTDDSATLTNGTSNSYEKYYAAPGIFLYPYRPHAAYDAGSDAKGLTVAATAAVGWTKMIGSTGAASMFGRCCVLSVDYVVTLRFSSNIQVSDGKETTYTTQSKSTAGYHYLRLRDQSESVSASPTTVTLNDSMFCQPEMRKQVKGGLYSQLVFYNGDEAAGGTHGHETWPGSTVIWRGKAWPHKIMDVPFSQYVGDDSSFGTSAAYPTNYGILDLAGWFPSPGGANIAPTIGKLEAYYVYTCLFKEPWTNQA